jgi:hypothetical protein
MPTAKPTPGKLLLSPTDYTLNLIAFQSQMAFATKWQRIRSSSTWG